MKIRKNIIILSAILVIAIICSADTANAARYAIGFFVGDSDAYTCLQAVKMINLPEVEIGIFTQEDIDKNLTTDFIKRMDIAIVDIMPRHLGKWLISKKAAINPGVRIYAVRMSGQLKDYLDAGFIMDQDVRNYYKFTSSANLKNLILFLSQKDLKLATRFVPAVIPPENGLYHPDAPEIFKSLEDYIKWYRQSGHYQPGKLWDLTIIFPTFPVDNKQAPVNALIRAYEKNGINTITLMRAMKDWDLAVDRLISAEPLKTHLGSITGFTFKFSSRLSAHTMDVLKKADVPVFSPIYLFFSTGEEWMASEQGVTPAEISLQFGVPELSGLIEPTVMGVKERVATESGKVNAYHYIPVTSLVEKQARRTALWHRLKQKANKDKKVVLIYYNHGGGKQNIGASYLNVFNSIREIISNMKQAGYTVDGDLSEDKIKDLLIRSGRNIGSWAPDELDKMIREGEVEFIPFLQYKKWLKDVDKTFAANIEKDWGSPDDSDIMTRNGKFIIPCIKLGNLILAPQPSRGWSDDPEKLFHSTVLYPHHQYTAFYLWLQNKIKPDVMINLGTHGTHEWLPGKQAGLSASCPPEVLIGDIPSLYPYIVDDVGEGIQAKRRGRGVIIDHATPPFKKGGDYGEYSKLAALISEYESSSSEKIRQARMVRIWDMAVKLGIDKDLDIRSLDDDGMEIIDHYILELKTEMIPYGLHTFGLSPTGEGLEETAKAIALKGDQAADFYKSLLLECGPSERNSLIRGLRGGYIPPASGNDPIRNPESLPTGKNFYSFDPDKVPSKEAWENGKKAADQLIDSYRKKNNGKYPEQIGIILWSVETIRDEGINVATALRLLGMKPVWDQCDKVTGVEPVLGKQLKRPRIDVLLQMSGLFRDTFPTAGLLLDNAVKQAATLSDVENFVKNHTVQIRKQLIEKGYTLKEAEKLSTVRLFSAEPGAYGTKVDNMTGSSGMWDNDSVVAEQGFINMVSYGYSSDIWGKPLKDTYRQNLKKVDATVHSISSNLYGSMDNDDMFQYLGGLSMAVRKESGKDPEVYVSMQKTMGQGHIEPISATIGRELRSRYLNPKWIEGMKKEKYAGARAMADFLENMWGWQVTTPKAIDKTKWEQTYEVYVEDKYGQDIKEFFNRENPWAYQSMTARMLEAARKGYWKADEKIKKKLAAEYAVNVVEKGVACCDHTCNNPMLNQMVVQIISLPGVLSPEIVEKFKLAVEQAAGKALDQQVKDRTILIAEMQNISPKASADSSSDVAVNKKESATKTAHGEKPVTVEGYKMEDMDKADDTTDLTSSGIQWAASLFILLIIVLFVWGSGRKHK
ncbi:MAG: cobaltochelatase subunit CobN [Proteobacteria bacterium]|nr:cobaltochelatase subunit CobN [Pseudomonadota bacterium]